MLISQEDIAVTLKRLGCSSTEIATSLKNRRIYGWRSSTQACPIAKYLGREFDGASAIVNGQNIMVKDDEDWVGVRTPPDIRSFMHAFDTGLYPLLDNEHDPFA